MKTTESKGGMWGQRPYAAVDNARSQDFLAGGPIDLARAGNPSEPLTKSASRSLPPNIMAGTRLY
jgi:hypothetical protein